MLGKRKLRKQRDQIAIMALNGFLSGRINLSYDAMASHSYQIADLMLKEREKGK